MATLYALLVGIDKYPHLDATKQLHACVSDSQSIESFLQKPYIKAQFDETRVLSIHNTDATKDRIVDGIRDHLGQAKQGDTVLFYYSGHGIREKCDIPAFQEDEIDNAIGGIVCSDFRLEAAPGSTVLSDKEFRYLLKTVFGESNPHVLFLFDCCHSGDHTRAILKQQSEDMRSRQIERESLPARPLEGFIFGEDADIQQKLEQKLPLEQVLPQADHVMMAACREIELAWEGGGKGAFTSAMIEVLEQHEAHISYHELQNRLLNRMRFFFHTQKEGQDKRQTPQLYIHSPLATDRYRNFLTNQPVGQPRYATVEFNRAENQYRLGMGALQGIPPKADGIEVAIFPAEAEAQTTLAHIKSVFPTYSTLEVPPDFSLVANKAYRAKLGQALVPEIRVSVHGDPKAIEHLKEVSEKFLKEQTSPSYQFVSDADEADYSVNAKDGAFYLIEAGHEHPLVQGLSYRNLDAAAELLAWELDHVARWRFFRDLEYNEHEVPASMSARIAMYPVEVLAWEYNPDTQQETPLSLANQSLTLDLTPDKVEKFIRFELVNHSTQALQVSLIYLSQTFGVYATEKNRMMEQLQPLLDPGESLASRGHPQENGKRYIRIHSGGYVREQNWPSHTDYLKLIVSATPFDISIAAQQDLPAPAPEPRQMNKFMDFGPPADENPPEVTWEMRTFELTIANPDYRP